MKSDLDHWKEWHFLRHCGKLTREIVSYAEKPGYRIILTTEAGSMAIADAYEGNPNAFQGYCPEFRSFYFALKTDV